MKKLTSISFGLLLTISTVVVVFSSCSKDDEPTAESTTTTTTGSTVAVTGISLDKTTLSLTVGGTSTLTATVAPVNATSTTITWTTSDATKATVSNGLITAVAAGAATITAKAGDKTVTCTVTITANSNTQINADGVSGTVTDAQGNSYKIVKIGTQWWMAENLKVTKYNDGTAIPNVTDATAWAALTTGAYCDYDNSTANGTKYGHLYNWYTVNTGKLAPAGWHVATDAEWTTLKTYLIANGYNYDGTTTNNKIAKALAAKTDWTSFDATGVIGNDLSLNNSTGFSALPGGYRSASGSFNYLGEYGCLWSATEFSSANAWYRELGYGGAGLSSSYYYKQEGFSVRCVRD